MITAIALIIPIIFNAIISSSNLDSSDLQKQSIKEVPVADNVEEASLKQLKSEGYSEDKTDRAKVLVEGVRNALEEIIQDDSMGSIEHQSENENLNNDYQEETKYADLFEKIDLEKAIYLLVKLEKDFGSMEEVLDEYLYSLQLGIDLDDYIEDKKAYEEEKEQKSTELALANVITSISIETKMIEKMQMQTEQNVAAEEIENTEIDKTDQMEDLNTIPGVSNGTNYDIRPLDPLEDIKEEIKSYR